MHIFEGDIRNSYFGAIPAALVTSSLCCVAWNPVFVNSLLVHRMSLKESNQYTSVCTRYLAIIL